jgi:cobalt-zinc-cadmium efflux system outer membrane protein
MKQMIVVKWCRQFAVASLAVCFVAPIARAQHGASRPSTNLSLTLDALVAEALQKNPELKFYHAEIAAVKTSRITAGLWPNPEVSGSVGQKSVRDSGLSAEGVAWSVSVVQPFEWPGRIGLRKTIANRDIELAELGLERFKIALAARVRTLAYGLFVAQEKARAAREVAERIKALREVLVQRDPAGLTPLLETRVIEATELSMQRRAADTELAAQTALVELNQLQSLAPDTRLAIAPTELAFGAAESTDALLALARTNNFELRARAVELTQQGFRVALAKNERFPSISVGPTFSEENAFDRERIFGVAVSFPLPLWNRNTTSINDAAVRQVQAEAALAVTARDIERRVVEAALTYDVKRREIAKWRPDAVEHFRDAAELADRHYRLGALPTGTYVELQKHYLEAVEGLLDTKKEALEAAQQLELLTGLPLPLVSASAKEEKK